MPLPDTLTEQFLRMIAKTGERRLLADLEESDRLTAELLAKIDPDSLRRAREYLRDG